MFRLMIAALLLTLTAQTAAASNACNVPAQANTLASQIVAGVNASRRAHGLNALAYQPRLAQAAMGHACDMAANGFFGHRGSNGSNSQARVRAAGYNDCTVAENLAWGYPDPGQIINGWMGSAGHRSNMLHPRVTEVGVGITQGPKGPNWVLVVGRRC